MSPPLWFANFLSYCLQVLLLVLAGTALPALFRLRAPRVLLAYWQGLLLTCLILPLLQPWKSPSVASSMAEGTVSISFQGVPAGALELHSWLYPFIAGVLLAGMLVRLAWLGLGLGRLCSIRRAAHAFDPLPDGVRELESRLRVSPAWYLSPEMESPATFGILPPSILLPQRFPTLSEAFQRAIAGHEMLHVVRRDWIFNLVEEFILTVFWFHLAVAWVINRIRLSREQAVDTEVVRRFSPRKPYMSALLEIASSGTGPALGAAPTFLKERQLANRIELLVKEITVSKTRLFLSLSAIAGLLILTGVITVWAFPLRAPAVAAVAGDQPGSTQSSGPAAPTPVPVTRINPIYPIEAKKAGIEGVVVLRATITKDGSISNLEVVRGDSRLTQAALDAVRQWRYPVQEKALVIDVTISFTLEKINEVPAAQELATGSPQIAQTAPKLITKVNPAYPLAAKKAGIEGDVLLRTTIEKDGRVSNVEVVMGHPMLIKAAIDAVEQWRYAPMSEGVITDVAISFTLERTAALGPAESDGVNAGVYRVGNRVNVPIPIYKPEPPYTEKARAKKLQGNVELQIAVGVDGSVTDVKVVKAFDQGLTKNAVDTVKTWKFKPATKAGKPIPWQGKVEISFRLF